MAGRNCAKCCVFPSFRGFEGSQSQLRKTGVAKDRLPKTSTKFAPRLRARAIWKLKSLKTGGVAGTFGVELGKICTAPARRAIWKAKSLKHRGFGALLEVELRKICTTPARQSDLEAKTVKTPGARDVFGGSKCFPRGRRRDFDTLQSTRQAQDFVRVAKTLAGVVDLKRD